MSQEPTSPTCCPPGLACGRLGAGQGCCPGDCGCLTLIEGCVPRQPFVFTCCGSLLLTFWKLVPGSQEEVAKGESWPLEFLGRNGGGPRLSLGVIPDLAEMGLGSACLGGPRLKEQSCSRAAKKNCGLRVTCSLSPDSTFIHLTTTTYRSWTKFWGWRAMSNLVSAFETFLG